MRKLASASLFVGLALLIGACGTDAAGPEGLTDGSSNSEAVESTTMDANGAEVIRFVDNPAGFFFLEASTGRQVIIGNDPRLICSGGNPPALVEIEHVILPNGELLERIRGDDLFGQIWDFGTFDCGLFLTEEPVVEGTVDLTATNYFQALFGNEPKNWGFDAHGAFTAHINCNPNGCNAILRSPND